MLEPSDFTRARRHMVESQIAQRGITDKNVLRAMLEVPREAFVIEGYEEFAYDDTPLPIDRDQTISQPFIVAFMLNAARVQSTDRVLEVGAGSGYATALLSRIAAEVIAVERDAELVAPAKRRLAELGYNNIELHFADGVRGWKQGSPYDVIIVSAAGQKVPEALKDQLVIGGRLVIPVGEKGKQVLLRVKRLSETEFSCEKLDNVRFVPLVEGLEHLDSKGQNALVRSIAETAECFADIDEDFTKQFEKFADCRFVLLGECTHGTAEFYTARAAITRYLIEKHDFNIVAVEADWPDAASVDRYIRKRPLRSDRPMFQRFPQWMWRNAEFKAFVEWLREHNAIVPIDDHVRFFGLDIYNLSGSIAAVLDYLDRIDTKAAGIARERYSCLMPWQHEPSFYAKAVLNDQYRSCEQAAVAQCQDLLANELSFSKEADGDEYFAALQNSRMVATAEQYYRTMYYGGRESWNLRDRSMFETLVHISARHGRDAKTVIWAHNSHIGDARYTDMGRTDKEINLGQLCRQRFDEDVALIGFGTNCGTVTAAPNWNGVVTTMPVRPAIDESFEALCHQTRMSRFALDFNKNRTINEALSLPLPQRFIGVVYRPESERLSHYLDASPAQQFDAYAWFDDTHAVRPTDTAPHPPKDADTYPFAL
ncbi:protein-L-isoaspartate(D-aspartate) O-methyltransferase [Brucella intermedia]|uniref:protein-L-isoaspartate(D-aspartate) O-methyltransferase n=1 Tax=Brucella intermedia TaxID=94625 RepID=UPI0015929070|nr:protein-L-isoaspartate(D-aspartate) O-methyltransferase [Brucella intermedia]